MLGFAVLGAIPGILIMLIVDFLDRKRPEPIWTLRRVAIAGGIAFFFAVATELVIKAIYDKNTVFGAVFRAYVMAAITEETLKLIAIRLFVWRSPEFDERTDGIVYGIRAGLGFAIVENIGYLLGTQNPLAFLFMFVMRSALTVPMHAICGAMIGHFGALQRFDRRGPGMFGGLLVAIFIHGTFDAAFMLAGVFAEQKQLVVVLGLLPIPVIVVGTSALVLQRMWRRAQAADEGRVPVMA